MAGKFSWPVKVCHEDTDAAGVIYHANYLKFMERARRVAVAMGFDRAALLRHNMLFIVRSATLEYLKPARLHDSADYRRGGKKRRCFLAFAQQVLRGSQVLTNATVMSLLPLASVAIL